MKEYDERVVVQRFITDGSCSEIAEGAHFSLKDQISTKFGLNPRDVVVVGSSKLGFSIAPSKRYKPFGMDSDVDVAIVSSPMFDDFWEHAFLHAEGGAFWVDKARFFKKIAEGWMRPDLMPRDAGYERRKEWWDFFAPLRVDTSHGPMKARAGLYKSWAFLEAYQSRAIALCKETT